MFLELIEVIKTKKSKKKRTSKRKTKSSRTKSSKTKIVYNSKIKRYVKFVGGRIKKVCKKKSQC